MDRPAGKWEPSIGLSFYIAVDDTKERDRLLYELNGDRLNNDEAVIAYLQKIGFVARIPHPEDEPAQRHLPVIDL